MDNLLFEKEDLNELKSVRELDDALVKRIQGEYFKATFVHSCIALIIPAVIMVLWILGVVQMAYGISEFITNALILLVAISITIFFLNIFRCIASLIFVLKINNKNFLWHEGTIIGKTWKYPATFSKKRKYYSIDDKYFAETFLVNPVYKKGTEVYFLYFPGTSENSTIGGVVVKI